jgi:HEAT repeat protein
MSRATMKSALAVAPLLAGAVQLPAQTIPPATKEQADKLVDVLNSNAGRKEKVDACRGLAVIGTRDAVPPLAALLGDGELSHMARYGLEPIPDPAVDEALRDALGRVKGRPLVGVIASIGMRRDTKAVEPLSQLLHHSDADVAAAAARALGRMATSDAANVLKETLVKAPPAVRSAVADACLSCAEALVAQGKRSEAAAMYEGVGKAGLPKHFGVAAKHGAILARRPADTP